MNTRDKRAHRNSLITPLLISVQNFASAPAGSHLFRFSRRSLLLALQLTARNHSLHETYVRYHYEKIRTSWILHQESQFTVRIFSLLNCFYCSLFYINSATSSSNFSSVIPKSAFDSGSSL